MALSEAEVALIRASWVRAREDPTSSGALLFKGLFTKFPEYLRLFNQFVDLDLEHIQENKRLVKHALKVIETITFVVDSIGDSAKSEQLNEALVGLVRGHLKRKIGLKEFRNLGIVLIDFICDLNNRRQRFAADSLANRRLVSANSNNDTNNSSTSSSQDSETMTSTLDKIRASSLPSSCSEDDNLLALRTSVCTEVDDELVLAGSHPTRKFCADHNANCADEEDAHDHRLQSSAAHNDQVPRQPAKLDAGKLVVAWTKLYGVVLELVRVQEDQSRRESE